MPNFVNIWPAEESTSVWPLNNPLIVLPTSNLPKKVWLHSRTAYNTRHKMDYSAVFNLLAAASGGMSKERRRSWGVICFLSTTQIDLIHAREERLGPDGILTREDETGSIIHPN